MKWLRYCIVMLSFMLFSPVASAGLDPVGWSVSGSLPAHTVAHLVYPPITYTFINNMPFQMVSPLFITKAPDPPGEFTFTTDTCSGVSLMPGQTCTVAFSFLFTTPGNKSVYLAEQYGRNVVPLPVLSTTTGLGPDPLVTGAVTIPLPAAIGAGTQVPFEFTYTNTNNGAVVGVVSSSSVTINPNPGGGKLLTVAVDTCMTLPGGQLLPGQSCTVSGLTDGTGIFEAGLPGQYTLHHQLTYTGGTGVTALSTSTVASQRVIPEVIVPLPNPMGSGEEQPVEFQFTNNSAFPIGNNFTTVTQVGGSFASGSDTCTGVPLPAGASCTVSGVFTSASPGDYSVTAKFSYPCPSDPCPGGTTVSAVTHSSGSPLVTGVATTPLPDPSIMGAGERQHIVFTFTNEGTGTVHGITDVTSGPFMGGTFEADSPPGPTTCGTGFVESLGPGDSCLFSGTFSSNFAGPGPGGTVNCSAGASIHYAGGTVAAIPTTSTGMRRITGVIAPGLPSSIGTGEIHPVVITYTNHGSGEAYGITNPTGFTSLTTIGGVCDGGASTTCGATLGFGEQCDVTCDFMANAISPPSAEISSTLNYAGGTTAIVMTTSTASQKVEPSVFITVPPSTDTLTSYPIEIRYTNMGSVAVSATGMGNPTITMSPAHPEIGVQTRTNCTGSLPPLQACILTTTFTPVPAGPRTFYSSWTYSGGTVSINPIHTEVVTFARKLTLNNYCSTDVWYAFSGAPVRKGCSDKNPCPTGSTCNAGAENGKGVCYWTNPSPGKEGFHLSPMKGSTPTTATVLIPDKDPANYTVWSGSFAGRTGCKDKTCETADCNSGGGDKSCAPGNAFTLPATFAQFILKRNAADSYSVHAENGVNLSMSMGPTDPTKTTPAYQASRPDYCATPGSSDASRIFKACSWTLKPPAYPNASSAVNYVWVQAGSGGACSTNTCPAAEVCGLSFNKDQFARVCGKPLGYWTAHQACMLNTSSASAYFDCNNAQNPLEGDVLKDLNACLAGELSMCAGAGNKERAAMVRWMKSACPSISTFPGDTGSSIYTCNTVKPSSDKKVVKMNVTDYTISFCPERAPNSPFRSS
ncbi:MAG: hypothetical protein KIT56_03915 [Gammaproteobacteria bacterium]|nr:hypothetical protein [Gammaproteobacteria bacterium]MCW5583023.1 hypothetical protein [Gammaproteobacteria bacterium]